MCGDLRQYEHLRILAPYAFPCRSHSAALGSPNLTFEDIGPISGELMAAFVEPKPMFAELVQMWTDSGRTRMSPGNFGRTLTNLGMTSTEFGPNSAEIATGGAACCR